MKSIIAPSILAADFANLAVEVNRVLAAGADWIHVDVMDGHFVPNLSMGPVVVEALRKQFTCPLDVHLMVERPEKWIDSFVSAGASRISVHVEATPHLHRTLGLIRNAGLAAGVALNPATGWGGLEHVLEMVDMVLLMTVNPGFGGQSFLPAMVDKVRAARVWLNSIGHGHMDIEVDGGVGETNIANLAAAGANVFVAGSSIFGAQNVTTAIHGLREQITSTLRL